MPLIGPQPRARLTDRLRLEPITATHAEDYWLVFQDDAVDAWYVGKPTRAEAQHAVDDAERSWTILGVHKWLVYTRDSGALVGRGGLSAMRLHAYDGTIRRFLPPDAWADEWVGDDDDPLARRWAEIGWALRAPFWGRGYAAEVGRAGLQFAFDELDMQAVVSFTERINVRSRAVMERIGMRYAGEFAGTGLVADRPGVHDDAPFALYLALRERWQLPG